MPELPEVETVVRALGKSLAGRRIAAVSVLHKPSIAGSPAPLDRLAGRRVENVFRRGKFIRMALDGGMGLAIHLRMTGWLGVLPAEYKDPRHDPYVRLRFALDGGAECLVFRDTRTFGRVWCGPAQTLDALPALAKLGPEPLRIDAQSFSRRLRERRGRVKALLLNQEFLAGIGNIYADESLFTAGLHPLASAARIRPENACALHAAIQHVLLAAIKAGGSSIDDFLHPDGQPGWFQRQLLVYGREGQPCSRCGAKIKRIVLCQRGTWFCPKCQKK